MKNLSLAVFAALVFAIAGAHAGEDPTKIYLKTDGVIDTANDTDSDGYMRAGTKLVVDCSSAGACVETPEPPLPPTGGPKARNDSYKGNMGVNGGGATERPLTMTVSVNRNGYKAKKVTSATDMSMTGMGAGTLNYGGGGRILIYIPVLNNDDDGPYGPSLVTEIKNVQGLRVTRSNPIGPNVAIAPDGRGVLANLVVHSDTNRGDSGERVSGEIIVSFKYTITDTIGQTSTAEVSFRMSGSHSPLVLDLDGDGVEMTTLEKGVPFDIDMDGVKDWISWIEPDDGLLVLDRNNDGIITHRRELFGNHTEEGLNDGFANLLRYDDNKDYVIDAQDKIFPSLLVWRDMNRDGVGTPDELKPLSAYDIVSINLNAVMVDLQFDGQAMITHQSTYLKKDGRKGQIADVWFSERLTNVPPGALKTAPAGSAQ